MFSFVLTSEELGGNVNFLFFFRSSLLCNIYRRVLLFRIYRPALPLKCCRFDWSTVVR